MNVPFAMNAEFMDSQYQRWRADAGSVSREWQLFFEGFELGVGSEDKAAGIWDQRQVLRQARVGNSSTAIATWAICCHAWTPLPHARWTIHCWNRPRSS